MSKRVPLRAPGKREITLAAPRPNASTQAWYAKQMKQAIANMAASYEQGVRIAYERALASAERADIIVAAQDASVEQRAQARANKLFDELQVLRDYWQKYFDKLAAKIAPEATALWEMDATRTWRGRLDAAGFTVKFQMTPAQRIVMEAKTRENVALIKSIPAQYHTQVEGTVLRGFIRGRDLNAISEELQKRHKITQGRAAFIARDQANKATAAINATRQDELGITEGIWQHSSAGKEPRPEHVKAGRDRMRFDLRKGHDFGDGFGPVLPGEAINCRCTWRAVIPLLDD